MREGGISVLPVSERQVRIHPLVKLICQLFESLLPGSLLRLGAAKPLPGPAL